ncbi:hypothetical protein G9U52_17840 [Paenibacillus sp. S3N08]|uniref:Uncharacterized protein n=1 Tax=Paenibacillus agricola TaxID=2716264 RepID=A0ABX0J7V4_9BACL|nr:hypothetical protein [Paenibacillus agricola]
MTVSEPSKHDTAPIVARLYGMSITVRAIYATSSAISPASISLLTVHRDSMAIPKPAATAS